MKCYRPGEDSELVPLKDGFIQRSFYGAPYFYIIRKKLARRQQLAGEVVDE